MGQIDLEELIRSKVERVDGHSLYVEKLVLEVIQKIRTSPAMRDLSVHEGLMATLLGQMLALADSFAVTADALGVPTAVFERMLMLALKEAIGNKEMKLAQLQAAKANPV